MTPTLLLTAAVLWVQPENCTNGGLEIGILVSEQPPVVAVSQPATIIPSGYCWPMVESTNRLWKDGKLAGRCVYTDGRPDSEWTRLPVGETILGKDRSTCCANWEER